MVQFVTLGVIKQEKLSWFAFRKGGPAGILSPADSAPEVSEELHRLNAEQAGLLGRVRFRLQGRSRLIINPQTQKEGLISESADVYGAFCAVAGPDAGEIMPRQSFPQNFTEQAFDLLSRFKRAAAFGVRGVEAEIGAGVQQSDGWHLGEHQGLQAIWNADGRGSDEVLSLSRPTEAFLKSVDSQYHHLTTSGVGQFVFINPDVIAVLKPNVLRRHAPDAAGFDRGNAIRVVMREI